MLLCFTVIAAACGAASAPTAPTPTTRGAIKTSVCSSQPPLVATIRITSPKSGEVVAVGDVSVAFEVVGAELVAYERATCPWDYHVHVALDRDVSQYLGTDVAVPRNAERIRHTPATLSSEPRSATFSDVAAGQHTAIAWLAFADHTSPRPAISTSVTFTAR